MTLRGRDQEPTILINHLTISLSFIRLQTVLPSDWLLENCNFLTCKPVAMQSLSKHLFYEGTGSIYLIKRQLDLIRADQTLLFIALH